MRISFALEVALVVACSTRADEAKAPLPDVDSVLTKANSRAHDFAEQALAMQQRLRAQQDKSRSALAAKRQKYEGELELLANQSHAIQLQNSDLELGNKKLAQMNADMVADLNRLREKNIQMRATLKNITNKVSTAQLFIADSLTITDDSNAKELEVLRPTTPRPTLDRFLAVAANMRLPLLADFAGRDDGANASATDNSSSQPKPSVDHHLAVANSHKLSLLAIFAKHTDEHTHAEDPKDLVDTLSASLKEIAAAEAEGAAELEAHFKANIGEALELRSSLNTTRVRFQQAKAELLEQRHKLLNARAHLQATSKQLAERLRGVRAFADAVDVVAGSALGHEDAAATAHSGITASATNATSVANLTDITSIKNDTNLSLAAASLPVAPVSVETSGPTQVPAISSMAAAATPKAAQATRVLVKDGAPPAEKTSAALRRQFYEQPVPAQDAKGSAGWTSWFANLR